MTTLVIAEHDNAELKGATLNAVAAAAQLGGDVHVLVAGSGAQAVAEAAAKIAGVAKVLHADAAHLADGLAENLAAQVLALASSYSHIVFPATASGKNVAPRIAAKLDVAQVSDIVSIESPDTFQRPIYAGNAIATVQSADSVKVLTVRTTGFDAVAAEGGSAAVEAVDAVADSGLSSFVGREVAKSDRPELAGARVVVSGGRGMGSAENFKILDPLADKLGAALGASRAAVDAGYAPNDWQVGQTGKIVAPQLYVAIGISGAIQHLAGMKDSKVIVAINKDEEAPIFGVADYGLVGDLFQVVPALESALRVAVDWPRRVVVVGCQVGFAKRSCPVRKRAGHFFCPFAPWQHRRSHSASGLPGKGSTICTYAIHSHDRSVRRDRHSRRHHELSNPASRYAVLPERTGRTGRDPGTARF